jgi:DNA-binding Lrp family transcriptional regulator
MLPRRTLPFDLVLGARLLSDAGTLAELAAELAVAPSQVHASLRRLERAGLLKPTGRAANPRALLECLQFGVRYHFPAERGRIVLGIPTAHAGPVLAPQVDAVDVVVWEAPRHPGAAQGFRITPLYRGAIHLPERAPTVHRILTVIDALRLGDLRHRGLARAALESLIAGN